MSIIKEYREFFTRHTQVNSGTKPDQETGFITQYFVGSILKFNRFLKGDYPSESVFKKFLESVTFKLNKEDTASEEQQGLVQIATDTEAATKTSRATNGTAYTACVVPHQLPLTRIDVPSGGTPLSIIQDNGLKLSHYNTIVSGRFRRDYQIELNPAKSIVINPSTKKAELDGDIVTPGNNYYYGTNNSGVKGWIASVIEVPAGCIMMWVGSSAPTGWALCDGSNGTPDLRDKFIVGAGDTYAIGATGGETEHTLVVDELPKHSHGVVLSKTSDTSSTSSTNVANGGATETVGQETGSTNNIYTDSSLNTESNYKAHNNLPPYYALTYIIKL